MSSGPPLLTICGLVGSVTTLAFWSAFRTVARSSLLNLSAKKCWLTSTLSSVTQPSVFPSLVRGWSLLPAAGHDGVVTCITNPFPSSFQASIPLEWPQGALHDGPEHPLICGSL